MAGLEPVVVFWTGWGLHFVVLLSFTLQVTLLLLSDIRRRNDWVVLKVIIWSAYMLADTTAIYALGHMSVVFRWSPEHHSQLMALWAPLLLVHLGGQDNISAYAIEDNRLWLRHLQTFMLQVAAAGYVLYLSSILSLPMSSKVSWAAILMLVVGVVKYGERIWALKRSNSCASSSLSATSYDNKQVSLVSLTAAAEDYLKIAKKSWNEELIVAYSLFDVPTQMFEGPTSYVQLDKKVFTEPDKKLDEQQVYMLHVVGMQLSMMYDLLYTKAAVVHTWYGFCSRVLISLPFTVATLLLFRSSSMSHGDRDAAAGLDYYYYKRADVAVTIVLLVGAVVVETMSVLRAIFSKWTVVLLYGKGWIITGNMVFSVVGVVTAALEQLARIGLGHMRRHCFFKLRQWRGQWRQQQDGNDNSRDSIKMVNSYSWLELGRMGQHSLFRLAYHSNYNVGSRVAKMMGLEDWWDSNVYSWSTEVPKIVITKVLELVSSTSTEDIAKSQGQNAVRRLLKHDEWPPSYISGPTIYRGDHVEKVEEEDIRKNDEKLANWIWMEVGNLKLDERILVWHIATHVYLQWCGARQAATITEKNDIRPAIEVLANYMFFLLAARPYMLPYPVSRQAYVDLCSDAVTHFPRYFRKGKGMLLAAVESQNKALIEGTQLQLQPDKDECIVGRQGNGGGETTTGAAAAQPQRSMNTTLGTGCKLAAKLIHFTMGEVESILLSGLPQNNRKMQQYLEKDITKKTMNSVTSKAVLNMLLEVWTEMLCYTAYLCNEKSHAKHLTDGCEIMTIITLLVIYMKKGSIREDTSTTSGTAAAGPSSSQGATDSEV